MDKVINRTYKNVSGDIYYSRPDKLGLVKIAVENALKDGLLVTITYDDGSHLEFKAGE